MNFNRLTRRDFSLCAASLLSALGISGTAFGSIVIPRAARPAATDEITHTSDAIHQEVLFKAPRKRVYEALTDAAQFEKVVQLSQAIKSGMVPPGKPAEISRDPGGAFALFGGYISGRQIELVPNERIVQAWRTGSWPAGAYSIAKFAFTDQDSNTKLIFDHTSFPNGDAQHLAEGWRVNYWEPLAKFLA